MSGTSFTGSSISATAQNRSLPAVTTAFNAEIIEFERTETLFSATKQTDFIARKTEPGDCESITKLVDKETRDVFSNVDASILYEKCCFSIAIADVVEPDLVVAAASFSDSPMDSAIKMESKRWKQNTEVAMMTPLNTLFMHLFVSSVEISKETALMKIVANTFHACESVAFIIVEAPNVEYEGPYLFSGLARVMEMKIDTSTKKMIFLYEKDTMFPQLVLREGREHDLDDLAPLLPIDTTLMRKHFGKTVLSDIIAQQERGNQTVVAEWDGIAVGIMAVTAEIDYPMLNKFFELEIFHGLYKPHPKDVVDVTPVMSNLSFQLYNETDFAQRTVVDSFEADTENESQLYTVESSSEASINTVGLGNDEEELDVYSKRDSLKPYPTYLKPPGAESIVEGVEDINRLKEMIMLQQSINEEKDKSDDDEWELDGSGEEEQKDEQRKEHTKKDNQGKDNMNGELENEENKDNDQNGIEEIKLKSKNTILLEEETEDYNINDYDNTSFFDASESLSVGSCLKGSHSDIDVSILIKPRKQYTRNSTDFGNITDEIVNQAELIDRAEQIFKYMEANDLTVDEVMNNLSVDDKAIIHLVENNIQSTLLKLLPLALPEERVLPFDMLKEPTPGSYKGIPNAIAVQLCAIDTKYEIRILDLIKGAFHGFPNREYLILTIPIGSKEPSWLNNFVRVPTRKESIYSRELFVMHRITLTSNLTVRKAKRKDCVKAAELLESMFDRNKIMKDFDDSVSLKNPNRLQAFVAIVNNHKERPIVGIAIVSPAEEAMIYQVNYDLDRYTYCDFHNTADHGYINHFVLNPLFQRFCKLFMKEILRLMKKDCLFHTIYPDCVENEITEHQSVLNNMDEMIPLLPRKRIDYADLKLGGSQCDEERLPPLYVMDTSHPHSVMHYSKKFSFDPKCNLNERIVFVGASETAISCLEILISSPFRSYKHLTVIDPYGLPGNTPSDDIRDMFFVKKGGKAMSFTSDAERAQRLGLNSWINVCYGWVTKILRDKKLVIVNKHRVVPYDILILTPGRQFHRPDCPTPEIDDPHFKSLKQSAKSNKRATVSKTFNRLTPKPKNVFMINTEVEAAFALEFLRAYIPYMQKRYILIHGVCLESFTCINALLALGISAKRIVLITTPDGEMEWESYTGFKCTPKVKKTMYNTLKSLEISIVENFAYSKWKLDEISGLVNRVYFKSCLEDNALISFPCLAFFSFCHKRVNDVTLSALTECYIVYEPKEGIIVDTKFRTNDPNIWAAGPATIYQKALMAEKDTHAFFQSEDIGRHLAEMLIQDTESVGGSYVNLHPLLPAEFKSPIIRAAVLPGGWNYFYMSAPGLSLVCYPGECENCGSGTEIITGSTDITEDPNQRYFRLWLDTYSRVEATECLSMQNFSASNLSGLYGHHESILNKLLERMERGEIEDLFEHFCRPWFGVFCHDRWSNFRQELKQLYSQHTVDNDNNKIMDFIGDYLSVVDDEDIFQVDPNILRHVWESCGLKIKVENKFLDYLKFNRHVVPMYARPDFVDQVLNERKTSPMYQPSPIKY